MRRHGIPDSALAGAVKHHVELQPGGITFDVLPGETVLEAALRQQIDLPHGCQEGLCGNCLGRLLAGTVAYDEPPPALDEDARAGGLALLCQARPLENLVVAIGAGEDSAPPLHYPARVETTQRLAPGVMQLWLRLPAAAPLPYQPGQYIDILLPDGGRRAFSLANAPGEGTRLELHVRRVAGGRFTGWVFDGLQAGQLLRIHGPLGRFRFDRQSSRPAILVAGGTGFAPIKAMIESLLAGGDERPLYLFRGARRRSGLYLDDLVDDWCQHHPNLNDTPVLSEPLPGDDWQGARGTLVDAVVRRYPDLSGYDVYAAGPPAMIDAATAAFSAHGLPPGQFHHDRFEFAAPAPARR